MTRYELVVSRVNSDPGELNNYCHSDFVPRFPLNSSQLEGLCRFQPSMTSLMFITLVNCIWQPIFTFTASLITLQDDCPLPDTMLLDNAMFRTDDKINTSAHFRNAAREMNTHNTKSSSKHFTEPTFKPTFQVFINLLSCHRLNCL
jgi:hypothetical protein